MHLVPTGKLPTKNSTDVFKQGIGAIFCRQPIFAMAGWHPVHTLRQTGFLFGRQGVQSLVFDNPSDEVTVKFSETEIFLVIYNRCIKI